MKILLFAGFLLFTVNLNAQTTVTIKITGMETLTGSVRMSLFNSEESYMKKAYRNASKKVEGKEVFTFENVPEGTYGASVYHDANENMELDSNFMGIPKEAYCFSNNARGKFGPASFEDCSFAVKGKSVVQELVVKSAYHSFLGVF